MFLMILVLGSLPVAFTQSSFLAAFSQSDAFSNKGCKSEDTVSSASPFAYALLKSVMTDPVLVHVFDTSAPLEIFYDSLHKTLKGLEHDKAELMTGSFTLLIETTWSRVNTLENAIAVTNAIDDFFRDQIIISEENFEELVDDFRKTMEDIIKADEQFLFIHLKAFVEGIMNYLAKVGALKPTNLHEFISRLAGRYYASIYSKCKPKSFENVQIVENLKDILPVID